MSIHNSFKGRYILKNDKEPGRVRFEGELFHIKGLNFNRINYNYAYATYR